MWHPWEQGASLVTGHPAHCATATHSTDTAQLCGTNHDANGKCGHRGGHRGHVSTRLPALCPALLHVLSTSSANYFLQWVPWQVQQPLSQLPCDGRCHWPHIPLPSTGIGRPLLACCVSPLPAARDSRRQRNRKPLGLWCLGLTAASLSSQESRIPLPAMGCAVGKELLPSLAVTSLTHNQLPQIPPLPTAPFPGWGAGGSSRQHRSGGSGRPGTARAFLSPFVPCQEESE